MNLRGWVAGRYLFSYCLLTYLQHIYLYSDHIYMIRQYMCILAICSGAIKMRS